jgi:hypothetical protein
VDTVAVRADEADKAAREKWDWIYQCVFRELPGTIDVEAQRKALFSYLTRFRASKPLVTLSDTDLGLRELLKNDYALAIFFSSLNHVSNQMSLSSNFYLGDYGKALNKETFSAELNPGDSYHLEIARNWLFMLCYYALARDAEETAQPPDVVFLLLSKSYAAGHTILNSAHLNPQLHREVADFQSALDRAYLEYLKKI